MNRINRRGVYARGERSRRARAQETVPFQRSIACTNPEPDKLADIGTRSQLQLQGRDLTNRKELHDCSLRSPASRRTGSQDRAPEKLKRARYTHSRWATSPRQNHYTHFTARFGVTRTWSSIAPWVRNSARGVRPAPRASLPEETSLEMGQIVSPPRNISRSRNGGRRGRNGSVKMKSSNSFRASSTRAIPKSFARPSSTSELWACSNYPTCS